MNTPTKSKWLGGDGKKDKKFNDLGFDELAGRFSTRILPVIWRQSSDMQEATAKDIWQETLINVFYAANLPSDKFMPGWFSRIAKNNTTNWFRGESRYREFMKSLKIEQEIKGRRIDEKDIATINKRAYDLLKDTKGCMKKLPKEMYEVVHLNIVLNWPQRKIAEELGISLGTVAKRRKEGLKRLLECLEKKGWTRDEIFEIRAAEIL